MPVGGETTRAILSAHTGTSSAKLFTDLTELEDGDIFLIHVLGETLAYRVCQTDIVLPSDITEFPLEEGRDLVSLVTCYPYGVNTHRLVVTGERTEYTESLQEELDGVTVVTSNAWAQDYIRALIIAGVCFALFVGLYVVNNIGNKKKNVKRKNMTPDPNALANAPVQMLMRPTASEEEKKK
jgi:sortase A